MESLVAYDSKFGNTKRVAEAIADGLRSCGPVRLLGLDRLLHHDLGTVDFLFVGSPTQARGISGRIRQFLDALETRPGTSIVAATFDTRYKMPKLISGSAAKTIARKLRRGGVRIFAPPVRFFLSRQGRELEQGETERARAWAKSLADALVLSDWCAA